MTQKTIDSVKKYFEEHEEEFNDTIESLDDYNGFLGDERYYPMEELDELYSDAEPSEVLARAYYGYDEDYGTDESGTHRVPFNPNSDYFHFNSYGNLVSASEKDYSIYLDDNFVRELEEYENKIDLPDEVADILDADEEESEE